jgi:hypothetical protein
MAESDADMEEKESVVPTKLTYELLQNVKPFGIGIAAASSVEHVAAKKKNPKPDSLQLSSELAIAILNRLPHNLYLQQQTTLTNQQSRPLESLRFFSETVEDSQALIDAFKTLLKSLFKVSTRARKLESVFSELVSNAIARYVYEVYT